MVSALFGDFEQDPAEPVASVLVVSTLRAYRPLAARTNLWGA